MKAYVRRTKDFLHQKAQVKTQPGFTFPGHQLLEEGQTLLVQSHTKETKRRKKRKKTRQNYERTHARGRSVAFNSCTLRIAVPPAAPGTRYSATNIVAYMSQLKYNPSTCCPSRQEF